MKLSDVMSAANLAFYAEVGLLIFMAVFASIAVQVLRRRNAESWEALRYLPLADEPVRARAASNRGVDR